MTVCACVKLITCASGCICRITRAFFSEVEMISYEPVLRVCTLVLFHWALLS